MDIGLQEILIIIAIIVVLFVAWRWFSKRGTSWGKKPGGSGPTNNTPSNNTR